MRSASNGASVANVLIRVNPAVLLVATLMLSATTATGLDISLVTADHAAVLALALAVVNVAEEDAVTHAPCPQEETTVVAMIVISVDAPLIAGTEAAEAHVVIAMRREMIAATTIDVTIAVATKTVTKAVTHVVEMIGGEVKIVVEMVPPKSIADAASQVEHSDLLLKDVRLLLALVQVPAAPRVEASKGVALPRADQKASRISREVLLKKVPISLRALLAIEFRRMNVRSQRITALITTLSVVTMAQPIQTTRSDHAEKTFDKATACELISTKRKS